MKRTVILLAGLFISYLPVQSQNCTDCRYLTEIFDSVQVTENIKFAEGENSEGDQQELFMDIYQPVGDTVTKRPVLLFAFGGAFVTGTRKENYVKLACRRYAKAGYVAAAMDYRIGIDFIAGLSDPGKEAIRVFFRSMQDLRASVEYVYYTAQNGNPYAVDTNLIFLGGASAGAIAALFTEYCDSPTKMAEIGDTSVLNDFGGFEASSSIYPGYSRDVAGIVNVAGAMTNADWVEAGKAPHISAHGDEDNTVPYEDDNDLNSGLGLLGITLEGSYLIDQAAQSKGLCSYLYTIEGGDHPSGGAPPEYFDGIFNRWMPRMHAIIEERTFCCAGTVSIEGDSTVSDTETQIKLVAENTGFSPTDIKWCSLPCSVISREDSIANSNAIVGEYYIATAYDSSCQATDFVRISEAEENPDTVSTVSTVQEQPMRIYPNPSNGEILISSETAFEKIYIIDMRGKIVAEKVRGEQYGTPNLRISIQHLQQGTYFVVAQNEKNIYRARLVKQ